MCIAILNTKNVTLKKELLNNCWENNGDGAGLLYMLNGKMQVFKEMKSFDKFYNEYIRVRKEIQKQNIVLHFRISTHGKVNKTNCHPFLVHEELGFVHNGMIYNVPTHTEYSDTHQFNELILKKMTNGFEYDEHILDMIEGYIGVGSKLIFLNANDDFAIVNSKAGHWNMGCWFSNSSYKQVNDWVDYGGTKKYKGSSYGYGGYSGSGYGLNATQKYSSGFSFHSDFYDESEEFCECCDKKMYGQTELDRGTCWTCHQENIEFYGDDYKNSPAYKHDVLGIAEDEGLCESCCNDYGPYSKVYNAHICDECYNWLEEGDTKEAAKKVNDDFDLSITHLSPEQYSKLISLVENKEYKYNKEINILELKTEFGTFCYDQNKKMWIKKSALLGA
jgi:hypothetical protein